MAYVDSSYSTKGALTLSNSIIGVSILAMPYLMKSCGIVLGSMLLIGSALLTRFTCHLLLKSAFIARRKTFEFIAFQSFGVTGKLLAELNIIGFMLGLLISFFVVFGDLGTAIISEILNLENTDTLRTITLVILGFGVALPLAMLKEINILCKISTLSIIFYIVLAFKIVLEALPVLLSDYWKTKVTLWEPLGVLKCLPIFALALSCQTQMFTICDSLPDPSLKTMNSIVKIAVYLCTGLYLIVGLFGYIGGCKNDISGNILVNLTPGIFTEIIKLGFVMSVALSFPLVVMPCRTSIYSLFFKKAPGPLDIGSGLMSELRFKAITFTIVFFTFIVGYLCPNIEIVLGFIGSTIGVLTCIIFPAIMFVRLSSKNTFERRGAQVIVVIGVLLLFTCTWIHIQTVKPYTSIDESLDLNEDAQQDIIAEIYPLKEAIANHENVDSNPEVLEAQNVVQLEVAKQNKLENNDIEKASTNADIGAKRLEPPVPELPDIKMGENSEKGTKKISTLKTVENVNKVSESAKESVVLQKLENDEKKAVLQQVEIIKKLEAHQEAEKKLLEERRQLLAEIINHKKVHNEGIKNEEISEKEGGALGKVMNTEKKTVKNTVVNRDAFLVVKSDVKLNEDKVSGRGKDENINNVYENVRLKKSEDSVGKDQRNYYQKEKTVVADKTYPKERSTISKNKKRQKINSDDSPLHILTQGLSKSRHDNNTRSEIHNLDASKTKNAFQISNEISKLEDNSKINKEVVSSNVGKALEVEPNVHVNSKLDNTLLR